MKNSISKKKIFISGSTTGIGYAIAKLFSGKGCWVGINGRNIKIKASPELMNHSPNSDTDCLYVVNSCFFGPQ